jgi:2-dehydro-3-deoxyglucarate aldolase
MPAPINQLKQRLLRRESSLGCWLSLASAPVAEALAHCGFDWLLIDAEHGPNDIQDVFSQLQAIDAARAHGAHAQAVVRVNRNNAALVKRMMDCGAQTIMFPAIETEQDARLAVASTRYPQDNNHGVRGISSVVRAGTYGLDRSYISTANAQASVIVQVESPKGFMNIAAIAATEGVDCIFFGTSDFAANMGHLGNATHSDVQTAIAYITAVCQQHGKAVGVYAPDVEVAQRYRDMGIHFISLHSDIVWLTRGASTALAGMR